MVSFFQVWFSYGTPKKVWWKCPQGHEYQMGVYNRTVLKCNCPICNKKKVLKGYNDLENWCAKHNRRDLLLEWDVQNDKSPSEYFPHSDHKVWWKCQKCGYQWKAKIDSRTRMHAGCPKCGIKLISESKLKPVINLDTKEKYASLTVAQEKTGINKQYISAVCRGKQKTAGHYHWAFIQVK
ncbi:zinc-ribbon domain-containing protein [Lactobacillus crispatus]|uniref:zinc-ribbon domain-containing protein n=1 Tax=Lactobacillus crispatus TaxID=47770 RepID=UPI003F52D938